ncbi:MAG: DUF3501 family protein [Alphaproteobacteria bacterium]|jgi:hypothetical protein|nr:DUF3501 family protein [Alphaproteobacteria bacterium]
MSEERREIAADDILSLDDYAEVRDARRREIIDLKRERRLAVGPYATFYFESYRTMLQQIQEMYWIEKGGPEQIADELAAYNPLVPQGDELVATVMFEIEDEARRRQFLLGLGGVEETMAIEVDGTRVAGVPEVGDQVERTAADGKTSSIHFMHFRFPPEAIARFREPGARVVVAVEHENYAHMAVMPEAVRRALAEDFA